MQNDNYVSGMSYNFQVAYLSEIVLCCELVLFTWLRNELIRPGRLWNPSLQFHGLGICVRGKAICMNIQNVMFFSQIQDTILGSDPEPCSSLCSSKVSICPQANYLPGLLSTLSTLSCRLSHVVDRVAGIESRVCALEWPVREAAAANQTFTTKGELHQVKVIAFIFFFSLELW